MLPTDEFAEFAEEVVLFCHVTTRVPGAKNDELLREKGGGGFPYLAWLDADGDVIAVHESDGSTSALRKSRSALSDAPMRTLKAKATSDTAKTEYLVAQLEKGWIGYTDAAERAAKIARVPPAQKEELDELLLAREVFLRAAASRNDEQVIATANRFLELAAAKKVPADEGRRVQFWGVVLKGTAKAKESAKLERAIADARRSLGTDSKARNLLEKAEEDLAKLKKKG